MLASLFCEDGTIKRQYKSDIAGINSQQVVETLACSVSDVSIICILFSCFGYMK